MHEKYTVIRNNHCLYQNTKESNRKSNKRLRDGQRTSSALTAYESVHCEQHNTQLEFPVNQSSQLPSTTSRHRASLAQDRKHVTSCLTQPPLLCCYHLDSQGWGLRHRQWALRLSSLINFKTCLSDLLPNRCLSIYRGLQLLVIYSLEGAVTWILEFLWGQAEDTKISLRLYPPPQPPQSTDSNTRHDTRSCLNITSRVFCTSSPFLSLCKPPNRMSWGGTNCSTSTLGMSTFGSLLLVRGRVQEGWE